MLITTETLMSISSLSRKSMMNIKEIIDQINYVMDEVEDTPDKYRQLHELGWQLIGATRPSDFYEDKEQAMKEQC